MGIERDLGEGLVLSSSAESLRFAPPGGATSLCFTRAEDCIRLGLQFGGGRMGLDVTFQPGAVGHVLEQAAKDNAVDPNRWAVVVLRELRHWSERLEWCPIRSDMLVAALGALGHPLLGQLFVLGHDALSEIPRWAVPVLRSPDVMSAARRLEPQATRRTARALAASLVSRDVPAPPEVAPLSYAVMGAGLIGVDDLTNLLEIPPPEGNLLLPAGEEIEQVRQTLSLWPTSRRAAVLAGAATSADPVRLADLMRKLWWVRSQAPNPLPIRWQDLVELTTRLVPVIRTNASPDARPARPVPSSSSHDTEGATPPAVRRRRQGIEVARAAPQVRRAPGTSTPQEWSVPTALHPVSGLRWRGLRLQVPTSAGELRLWGMVLHNCLGDFAPAVASGRSWIIGIEVAEAIIGCVEVEASSRTVRQILGDRNRPLPRATKHAVLEALEVTGIVRR